jgi:hypothetical protein
MATPSDRPGPQADDLLIDAIWAAIEVALRAEAPVAPHDIAVLLRTIAEMVEQPRTVAKLLHPGTTRASAA